jgi:predicted molibdopterin-dependent oxidoreductase YjgC
MSIQTKGWLCDRGRYNFEYLNSDQRIKAPLEKDREWIVKRLTYKKYIVT